MANTGDEVAAEPSAAQRLWFNKGLNLTKGTEEYALRASFINVPFAG